MIAVFKKEFRSCFHNMIGPVFIAAILCFMGLYFSVNNISYGYPYYAVSLSGISVVLLLLVPVLTMRSFAEEKRSKTDQMLLTSPLSVTQIVMGKFLAMAGVLGICAAVSCLAPLVILLYGGGNLLADYVAILAFFLMGAAYISMGMFISSLTENQVLAAVGTFCLLLFLQLSEGIAGLISSSSMMSLIAAVLLVILAAVLVYFMTKNVFLADAVGILGTAVLLIIYGVKKTAFEGLLSSLLSSVSLISGFDTIINQTLDLSVFVLYLSVIGLFIFLTVQSVQKRRWS
ncbi:MAG: ABC transporter permease [Anaerovoracaceae bacterium]